MTVFSMSDFITSPLAPELCNSYFRITPGRFHYLKFILEGYDNLAVLSSTGVPGTVRLKYARESASELFSLLASIAADLR